VSALPTCGQGIARNAAFPAALAEVLGSLAENLELHLTAIDPNSPVSKPEHAAYVELTGRQREIERGLRELAERMRCCHDLPMAEHDEAAFASPRFREAFEAFVQRQRELVDYLQLRLAEDQAMLARWMRSGPSTPGADGS
jgi:hypothetical protein